jgi:hypothetical protein
MWKTLATARIGLALLRLWTPGHVSSYNRSLGYMVQGIVEQCRQRETADIFIVPQLRQLLGEDSEEGKCPMRL